MAEQLSAEELSQLQRELALERAAREELERQTVLKTRQLWQLRDQQDKEVQQYQVCVCQRWCPHECWRPCSVLRRF